MKLNTIQRIKTIRRFEVAFRGEELDNRMYHGICYKPSIFRLPKMFGFDLRICLTDMMILNKRQSEVVIKLTNM